MIQRDVEQSRHSMYFPNSTAIQGMSLSQNPTSQSSPRFSFMATIRPRREIARGNRSTEAKHFAVRDLKWHAKETVKIMTNPVGGAEGNYSICEQQLCDKFCKG
jgi:hypothetical protein